MVVSDAIVGIPVRPIRVQWVQDQSKAKAFKGIWICCRVAYPVLCPETGLCHKSPGYARKRSHVISPVLASGVKLAATTVPPESGGTAMPVSPQMVAIHTTERTSDVSWPLQTLT